MIYFTSDWHLRHSSSLKYCNRPFNNTDAMAARILFNYKEVIKDTDIVFHCGDLTIKRNSRDKGWLSEVFKNLPGQNHLIVGNHDYYSKKYYMEECNFLSVNRYISTKDYAITHDPTIFKDEDILTNKILLHGHIHSTYPIIEFDNLTGLNGEYTYDVGVDANNFKPVSLEYIKEIFKQPYTRKPK